MTGNTNTRNCNKTTTSALRPMERARGQDYAGAAECFVDAFFLKRNGGGDRITKSELAYLNGAQRKDLVSRYNQKNKGVMFVIKDADTNKVVGCVGAEVQKFVVNVPLRRAESDGELAVTERPVIANLAVDSAFRKQGIAKALMRAIEEECLEWGYTETVLVVEAKNKQAIGLYKKSGYKPVLTEAETPNLTIDENGKVAEAKVKAVTMRKSLVGGSSSLGSLEPAAVAGGVGLVGIVYLLATNGIELPF